MKVFNFSSCFFLNFSSQYDKYFSSYNKLLIILITIKNGEFWRRVWREEDVEVVIGLSRKGSASAEIISRFLSAEA